jgi:hypothetical protein
MFEAIGGGVMGFTGGFVIGAIVGGFVGIFTMCLCIMAGRDKDAEY